jgi:hypothetical protein
MYSSLKGLFAQRLDIIKIIGEYGVKVNRIPPVFRQKPFNNVYPKNNFF